MKTQYGTIVGNFMMEGSVYVEASMTAVRIKQLAVDTTTPTVLRAVIAGLDGRYTIHHPATTRIDLMGRYVRLPYSRLPVKTEGNTADEVSGEVGDDAVIISINNDAFTHFELWLDDSGEQADRYAVCSNGGNEDINDLMHRPEGAPNCEPCDPGKIGSSTRTGCSFCGNNTIRPADSQVCFACVEDPMCFKVPNADRTKCICTVCKEPNEFKNEAKTPALCEECPAGKVPDSEGTVCDTCLSDVDYRAVGMKQCERCPAGKMPNSFLNPSACEFCDRNMYRRDDMDDCEPCEFGDNEWDSEVATADHTGCTQCGPHLAPKYVDNKIYDECVPLCGDPSNKPCITTDKVSVSKLYEGEVSASTGNSVSDFDYMLCWVGGVHLKSGDWNEKGKQARVYEAWSDSLGNWGAQVGAGYHGTAPSASVGLVCSHAWITTSVSWVSDRSTPTPSLCGSSVDQCVEKQDIVRGVGLALNAVSSLTANRWVCFAGGVALRDRDIDEDGSGIVFMSYAFLSGQYWKLGMSFRTHGSGSWSGTQGAMVCFDEIYSAIKSSISGHTKNVNSASSKWLVSQKISGSCGSGSVPSFPHGTHDDLFCWVGGVKMAGDVNEKGRGDPMMRYYTYKSANSWKYRIDARTHGTCTFEADIVCFHEDFPFGGKSGVSSSYNGVNPSSVSGSAWWTS